jgi:hypothetical protein
MISTLERISKMGRWKICPARFGQGGQIFCLASPLFNASPSFFCRHLILEMAYHLLFRSPPQL